MSPSSGRPRAAAACARPDSARPHASRGAAAFALAGLLVALAGCSWRPQHRDWVIHSSIQVTGPLPANGYRLGFPYIVGDFYGPPDTGNFVAPVSQTAAEFTLDLNRTQKELESVLGPTDFSLRFLRIAPRDARVARLIPIALQRDGIEPVGRVEWLDARSRRPVMLVYVDRPARIAGSVVRGGETLRYDIRVAKAGYVWIGAVQAGEHDTLYTSVAAPQRLLLTITGGGMR